MKNIILLSLLSVLCLGCKNPKAPAKSQSLPIEPTEVFVDGGGFYFSNLAPIELIKTIRTKSYNPLGYRFYFEKTTKDDYGNFKTIKEFLGGLIKVDKEYYDEIRKFNVLSDIVEVPSNFDRIGTEKGYAYFERLNKCITKYYFLKVRQSECTVSLN